MNYIIFALGNPGEEYSKTRHNTGKIILESVAKHLKASEWEDLKRGVARVSKVKIGTKKAELVSSETYMNKSGLVAKLYITSKKKAEFLVVIHDDLDLPLGMMKCSFNRGTGGHNGVKSVAKAVGTEAFLRVRVGISKKGPKNRAKKPVGETAVEKHILGNFTPAEYIVISGLGKRVSDVLKTLITEGRESAVMLCNTNSDK